MPAKFLRFALLEEDFDFMTYAEKLKDPRWQKKRLEVLESAGWKCEYCGRDDLELHVHHLKYTGEPWEAPMEDLEALCVIHHGMRTRNLLALVFLETRASLISEFFKALEAISEKGCSSSEITKRLTESLR